MASRIDVIFATAKKILAILDDADLSAERRQAVMSVVMAMKNEGLK